MPEKVEDIVLKAMHKRMEKRYQTATELLMELENLLKGESEHAIQQQLIALVKSIIEKHYSDDADPITAPLDHSGSESASMESDQQTMTDDDIPRAVLEVEQRTMTEDVVEPTVMETDSHTITEETPSPSFIDSERKTILEEDFEEEMDEPFRKPLEVYPVKKSRNPLAIIAAVGLPILLIVAIFFIYQNFQKQTGFPELTVDIYPETARANAEILVNDITLSQDMQLESGENTVIVRAAGYNDYSGDCWLKNKYHTKLNIFLKPKDKPDITSLTRMMSEDTDRYRNLLENYVETKQDNIPAWVYLDLGFLNETEGDYNSARELYQNAMETGVDPKERGLIETRLKRIKKRS